ncbi:hypothetical protein HK103_004063 [Boothiomyces macroporosus]|uniref:DNA ligase n=1 Tax=Boothiomyces macroporosus TaxID=261099 RepID=A0AAD5UH98_9FUNG|nr:hypothetical protein HK103_004063 [Boothiomyces macroporosus]
MSKKQPTISSFFNPLKRGIEKEVIGNGKKAKQDEPSESRKPILKAVEVGKENEPKIEFISKKTEPKTDQQIISYGSLCETFEKIENTTKRLEITSYLTKFFVNVIENAPDSLLPSIGPEYDGKELGIGESLLMKALAGATGRTVKAIKADMEEKGDLGTIAQASKGKQMMMMKPKPHTVNSVFEALKTIANFSGASVLEFNYGHNKEKSLEGKLRIGLAHQTILIALSHAVAQKEPGKLNVDKEYLKLSESKRQAYLAETVAIVKQVFRQINIDFSEIPSYDMIIPALLEHGSRELAKHCQLSPGIPLKPMLAHPTKSLTDVLNRFEGVAFTCEYKYDGERAQIHLLKDGRVMVYSRNSENLSEKYPDIIERMPSCVNPGIKSFVLDCEAVAWDIKHQCILPFQVLSTRKRKDVQTKDIQVQVCIFAFDLLYLNGEALVKESLKKRRELLKSSFKEFPGQFEFAKSMESNSVDDIQNFLDASIAGNCEGLMVKTLEVEASYEPSKRSRNWLKVKKDYINGMGDSLDLVVIGAFMGKGKRTGTYGAYLLACYDDDKEEYQTTGFSDENLTENYKLLKQHVIDSPPSYYAISDSPNVRPDVWFSPTVVWEVKAADLSISPVHKAAIGIVDPSKGISLRFPRFIRVRDDKTPENATNATQVAEFYNAQNLNSVTLQDDEFEY